MLLIDGVRYDLWTPLSEDEFERVVVEHASDIFGQDSIYFDRKQKLKSLSGIGSIPDGYTIILGVRPEWHVVEVELSSHPLHEHIVSQVSRFLTGIANPSTRNQILRAMFDYISGDRAVRLQVEEAMQSGEVYKFLADLIANRPVLTIIIEEKTSALEEAISTLAHPEIKVVEFKTYVRQGVGLDVHAHLFEPLSSPSPNKSPPIAPPPQPPGGDKSTKAQRVTFQELVGAGLLRDRQVLCFYNTRLFADERAKVITSSNQLEYEADGRTYSKSELAKILLVRHGFRHDDYGVAGPRYWKTEDGQLLRDLEENIRSKRGDRG